MTRQAPFVRGNPWRTEFSLPTSSSRPPSAVAMAPIASRVFLPTLLFWLAAWALGSPPPLPPPPPPAVSAISRIRRLRWKWSGMGKYSVGAHVVWGRDIRELSSQHSCAHTSRRKPSRGGFGTCHLSPQYLCGDCRSMNESKRRKLKGETEQASRGAQCSRRAVQTCGERSRR